MKLEKGSVNFGKRRISFLIKRSNRRRTISIFVDPYEGIFIRAPIEASIQTLSKLVHSKAIWILNKSKQLQEIKGFLIKKQFINGETFFYLGKQLRLKIVGSKKISNSVIKIKQGRFVVNLNSRLSGKKKISAIRKGLISWYKKHAKNILLKRVEIYSGKIGISLPGILVVSQTKRWGSCSSRGIIRFNWNIVLAPMSLVDYVVVHELCHLKYNNHSCEFWKLLGSIIPDYEQRKERLKKTGWQYIFK